MYNMPFFGFPYYRNYYSKAYSPKPNINYEKNSTTNNSSSTINDNSRSNTDNSQAFINLFGIDLYSDDILILCILLSLYLEGVKDEMLFISLILLLLS